MSTLVVFNPISGAGRGRTLGAEVAEAARRRGLEIELLPTSPGPASGWLRGPLADRDALVVVGGGAAAFFLMGECVEVGDTETLYGGGHTDDRTLGYLEGRFG